MTSYRVIATTTDDNDYTVVANFRGIDSAMAYMDAAKAAGDVRPLEIIEADRYAR